MQSIEMSANAALAPEGSAVIKTGNMKKVESKEGIRKRKKTNCHRKNISMRERSMIFRHAPHPWFSLSNQMCSLKVGWIWQKMTTCNAVRYTRQEIKHAECKHGSRAREKAENIPMIMRQPNGKGHLWVRSRLTSSSFANAVSREPIHGHTSPKLQKAAPSTQLV